TSCTLCQQSIADVRTTRLTLSQRVRQVPASQPSGCLQEARSEMEARSPPLSTRIGGDAPPAGPRPLPTAVQGSPRTRRRVRLVTAAVLLAVAIAILEVWLHMS